MTSKKKCIVNISYFSPVCDYSISRERRKPWRFATNNLQICKLCVHWSCSDFDQLLLLIPQHLEGYLHVYLAHVSDILSLTAGYLHATEESKVDPFQYPSPGVHGNIEPGGDDDSVVLQQDDPQGVPTELQVMPSS